MKYITIKDYDKAEKLASEKMESIPKTHNRKRIEEYTRVLKEGIKATKERKAGKPVYIVYTYTENLGTRKWPYTVERIEIVNFEDYEEKEKTFCRSHWHRISKDKIIAMVKA